MANTLFRASERLLVEEKFLDTAAYEFLAGACERLMNETDMVEPQHPSELFYQCFIILDTLKCKSPSLRASYCDGRVWDELSFYFRENGLALSLADLPLFIGCIMQGAAELLLRAGEGHLSLVAALKRQIQRHAPQAVKALDHAYQVSSRAVDEEELCHFMREYMGAEEKMYSADINEWLDELEKSDGAARGSASDLNANAVPPTSSVRIAPRMKTSVLVVLNAMFKAGWFVAEDGSELKNRDAALNDILRHAFAIDKPTAISQTINPSNNPNVLKKNELLLRQLLDEDEMEAYIKQLQGELLDAYEE